MITVGHDIPSVPVLEVNQGGYVIDNGFQAGLAFLKILFRPFAVGDVVKVGQVRLLTLEVRHR